jgi:putative acetyltransferase
MTEQVTLRPYADSDQEQIIELWRRTWQHAYPEIDFAARLAWWRERWSNELVPAATITVAELAGNPVGFVTVDPTTGYLDQLVVAPEAWGKRVAADLLAQAKRISPRAVELHVNLDNMRAIRFYEKHGFRSVGETVNPHSQRSVLAMRWRGSCPAEPTSIC